jgi:hypothetical protein
VKRLRNISITHTEKSAENEAIDDRNLFRWSGGESVSQEDRE